MSRTVLVTGASGGIGGATARRLGAEREVVVHYHRDRAGAEEVAEDIASNGGTAITHECDLTDVQAVEAMVRRVREDLGPVEVLVNNAGILHTADIATVSPSVVRETVAINLEGAIHCTRAIIPSMLDRGEGWIVNVSSTAGIFGSSTDATYGATKSGLIGFTKSLAKQYTSEGVFTNAVAPGPTATEMYAPERRPAARDRSPIGRLIEPDEVAEAIEFFVGTSAITGEVLAVDGGIHP